MSIRWLLLYWAVAVSVFPKPIDVQASMGKPSASGHFGVSHAASRAQVADLGQARQRIIGYTNTFRQTKGLGTVEPQAQLGDAARDFADFMARTDRYGHSADGKTPAQRAQQHGYDYCLIAENIAYQSSTAGFTTEELARGFFEGWQRSPEHRENLLNAAAIDIGVAVAQSKRTGTYYAVQLFGRRKALILEFQISNRSAVSIPYMVGGQTLELAPQSTRTHQACEVPEVIFQWPNMQEPTAVQPRHGDHYAIMPVEADSFRLEKR